MLASSEINLQEFFVFQFPAGNNLSTFNDEQLKGKSLRKTGPKCVKMWIVDNSKTFASFFNVFSIFT